MPTATPKTNNIVPNTLPVLSPIPNRFLTLGQTLSFTALGSDTDVPAQTLTYSLAPGAPSTATLNPFSGFFSWTPSAAPATNSITVVITDNGTPALSTSQTFTVTVFPPPQLGNISLQGNQLTFTLPTIEGQQYQLEFTDSISGSAWNPSGPVIVGTGSPVIITNDITLAAQRFYRLRLLP
jgi:hypothetical protein